MSELTVTLLRFGFLALLWVLIIAVVLTQGRDLSVNRRARRATGRSGAPAAERSRAAGASSAPEQAPRHLPQALLVTQGPTGGRTYQLDGTPVLMGRSPDCTVPLEDDYASGRHARLFPQGSRWFLEDLGSTNGTYIDEQRLTRAVPVEAGRPFRVGKSVLELRS